MASKIDNDELKRLALVKLAEGRAELTAQADRLRTTLNPKLAARRVFEQHTGTMVLATVAAGLAVTVLVFRGRHHAHDERLSRKDRRSREHAKEPGGSFLGTLVQTVAPVLIKIAITQPLADFFAPRRQEETDPA